MCKSVDRALVHLQVEQAVAVEIEVDALACAQGHGAELRLDHAVVADPGAQQAMLPPSLAFRLPALLTVAPESPENW